MHVKFLLVEGKLDAVVLDAVLGRSLTVQRGGSKYALKPKADEARRSKSTTGPTYYIRDRDFDFDPPSDRFSPRIHSEKGGRPVGWYWCRHEMENYLLEPGIVAKALECDEMEYRKALLEVAPSLCDYEAARATIGSVRRILPPNYDLRTRPDGLNELAV
ncbi:MAG TPA: hypothetical protein PK156_09505, partial [Polyangium sp.]|nr:hypothetical protein [Polyangium sp.]